MIDIPGKVIEHLQKERKSWAPNCNYASSAGYPCERKLVYDRLNWQEKLLPQPEKLLIFEEGRTHEKAVLGILNQAGVTVIEQQRPFELWEKINTRGRIDGRVADDGRKVPLEIKSMNHFDFEKIHSVEDMRNSTKHWIRGYLDTFQLYLLMMNEPDGVILFKDKQTGRLKQIVVSLDYEHAERVAQKMERVEAFVQKKEYPERIADRHICETCDFRHICLPDEEFEVIKLEDNPELTELLEERETLKEGSKRYEEIQKTLRGLWQMTPEGTYLVGGKFQVKIKVIEKTFYNTPPEIEKQYEEKKTETRATIVKLQ